MSRYADIMRTTGLPALCGVFGDAAFYTPPYMPPPLPAEPDPPDPVACQVIINRATAMLGQYGQLLDLRPTIAMDSTLQPVIGGLIAVGSETYHIDQIESDDGLMVRLQVRKVTP